MDGEKPYNLRSRANRPNYNRKRLGQDAVLKKQPEVPSHKRQRTLSVTAMTPSEVIHKMTRSRSPLRSSASACSIDSDDERRYDRQQAASRCRLRVGSSTAVNEQPVEIDRRITFDCVGGLSSCIKELKEMIIFPLLYPEFDHHYNIVPPKGALFYGPPGTGKTLMARALANQYGLGNKRITFFMRKGADCLSQWVGESERQIRLLFEQAHQMRPSIIFFDEFDGLAPVRSSRMDQIHNSIVATLLAMIDGVDNRGNVIVIGATNRVDAIDPAFRRPGRFDQEFFFPIPSEKARNEILRIHTKNWNLEEHLLNEVARKAVGFSGADLRALCSKAARLAREATYPQIYFSSEKLELEMSQIRITMESFHDAVKTMVPSSARMTSSPPCALSEEIAPLLEPTLRAVLDRIHKSFPSAAPEVDDIVGYFFKQSSMCQPRHSARILLLGHADQAHTTHLAPAVLHHFEKLPVHRIDLNTLYKAGGATVEENCVQIFSEANRKYPCIVYAPKIDVWWDVLSDAFRLIFFGHLQELSSRPILFFATATELQNNLPEQVTNLFREYPDQVIRAPTPTAEAREAFFSKIFLEKAVQSPNCCMETASRILREVPVAAPSAPRQITDEEQTAVRRREESTLRELRIFLRDVLKRLAEQQDYEPFNRASDLGENAMDIQVMITKNDRQRYSTIKHFMDDVDLLYQTTLSRSSDTSARRAASALRDQVGSILDNELDVELSRRCEDIEKSRQRKGRTSGLPVINQATLADASGTEARRTFSMRKSFSSHPLTLACLAMQQKTVPTVRCKQEVLKTLMKKTVQLTSGMEVEPLLRLYHILQDCMCRHTSEYNKDSLIEDLKTEINKFAKSFRMR